MWGEILSYQFGWSQSIIDYFHYLDLPYDGTLMPSHLPYFDMHGLVFIVTFLTSIIIFYIGILLNRVIGFTMYNHTKYRIILFFNLFYIFPFLYGFVGGKFNISNIFFIFLGNITYFGFAFILNNPDISIDVFQSLGIPL